MSTYFDQRDCGQAANLITLVLGGARSGKSRFAENLLADCPAPLYIATAEGHDEEMEKRIARHRQQRAAHWTTVEEPLELAAAIMRRREQNSAVLIDCLTLWLSNLMHAQRDIEAEIERLLSCLRAAPAQVVLVSNEVGLGIVPDNAMARDFRDHAGRMHQAIAALADRVFFVVAGIATKIKGSGV